MPDPNIEIIKQKICTWAKEQPLIKRIYIYGSRVRGDYTKESDLDIAIEFHKYPTDASVWVTGFFEISDLREDIKKLFPGYKVQVEHLHPTKTPYVKKGVDESRVLAYENDQYQQSLKIGQ